MKTIEIQRMIGGVSRTITYYYTDHDKVRVLQAELDGKPINFSNNEKHEAIKQIKRIKK